MHLFIIPHWINQLSVVLVSLFALWKGGRPERIWAVVRVAVMLYPLGTCSIYACPEMRALVAAALPIMLTQLAAIVFLALRYDRYWLIWASSFCLLHVVTDLVGLYPGASWWAFASAHVIWTYCSSLVLAWGTWSYAREQRGPAAA